MIARLQFNPSSLVGLRTVFYATLSLVHTADYTPFAAATVAVLASRRKRRLQTPVWMRL